jgi:hypothetical protein
MSTKTKTGWKLVPMWRVVVRTSDETRPSRRWRWSASNIKGRHRQLLVDPKGTRFECRLSSGFWVRKIKP